MSVTTATRVRVPECVHSRSLDGQLVLLHLERGEYFGLDDVGARLWEELARGRSVEEAATSLAREYEADLPRIVDDALSLTTELVDRGLVVTDGVSRGA